MTDGAWRDERRDAIEANASKSAPKNNSAVKTPKKWKRKLLSNVTSGLFNAVSALAIVGSIGTTFDSGKANASTSFDTQNSQDLGAIRPKPKGLGE